MALNGVTPQARQKVNQTTRTLLSILSGLCCPEFSRHIPKIDSNQLKYMDTLHTLKHHFAMISDSWAHKRTKFMRFISDFRRKKGWVQRHNVIIPTQYSRKNGNTMVPLEGFEPPTLALRKPCSTSELQRRHLKCPLFHAKHVGRMLLTASAPYVNRLLTFFSDSLLDRLKNG